MENIQEEMDTTSSNATEQEALPGYKTVNDFTKEGFKCMMEGIKCANTLPAGRDWSFYSTFESFNTVVKEETNELLEGMMLVLKKNEVGVNMRNQTTDKKTELLIDSNDIILEKVADHIDEMNGIRKTYSEPVVLQTVSAQLPVNINGSWNRNSSATFSVSSSIVATGFPQSSKQSTIRLLAAENIVRPQKFFTDKIDNRNDYPWEPRIKDKPNSLKPLAIFLEETESGRSAFSHPYEFELDRFSPPDELLVEAHVQFPKLLKDTPLIEINNASQLAPLVDELRAYTVIAVDVEHHSYRSFMGITCLLQISTFDKDYLIDTLSLRNDLWILNEIFTKPDITKVFHGADSDIIWLQRDLSLYVVNLFDTFFAAKHLEYSKLSLAYLMERFCKIRPNKKFQLADWRMRPLPDELKNYAREDTHYLIFIYQKMRNELLQKANGNSNLLKAVIDQSTTLCKKRYFKPYWHEDAHLELYSRSQRNFDNKQMFAFKELYKWRDNIARTEDESTGYVLPNNMLMEVAARLPKEMQGILACCSPVPPMVKANLLELHKIVLKALERPFEEPILKEDTRARGSTKKISKINIDNPLHCPHDLSKNQEFRDDLPTLLQSNTDLITFLLSTQLGLEVTESVHASVFDTSKPGLDPQLSVASAKLRHFKENFKFRGPFERYKLVRPFVRAKEKKLAEERATQEEEAQRKVAEESKKADGATERTDEERIESIREHFLELARKTLPPTAIPPKKASLLDMGGSKKRTRCDSVEVIECNVPESSVCTPIPNVQMAHDRVDKNKNGRMRPMRNKNGSKIMKIDQALDSQLNKVSKRERNRLRMAKRKEKKVLAIVKNEREEWTGPRDSLPAECSHVEQSTSSGGKRGNRGRGRGRGGRYFRPTPQRNSNDTHNEPGESEEFNSFDYSMVDFRQFQGGARGAQKNKQFNSKFRGRGKPNRRGGKSQNNRSMSFGRGKGFGARN
ncbi:exosome component 10 isoform X2 [Dendroctonus ponderosae]|uniref:exosome component 10 isoform X2 n=1 Tax=Dendroctonus ponderosae TaxID=77166 RepID=UPI0020360C52|nr:exosome component 10 isoform X2 [Dendroctonus ponderosae]KAH1024413.1 hypothetical protein HUJ05_003898 [Dendroctonus ponderosae]